MKKKTKTTPQVNPELSGLSIEINTFGEIKSSVSLDQINAFLDKHVEDKKIPKKKR